MLVFSASSAPPREFFDLRPLEFSGEGLVQQRLLQRLQRGVLPLVEAGEALGFVIAHHLNLQSGATRPHRVCQ